MKKIILLIILFTIYNQSFSQDLLTPINSNSFGLNHHTNRDITYFSHVDNNDNSIIIATTEKDSTYTDILTTKLDENLDLIWQKRISIATNLSYDIPLKSFINANNEIYIIGRSSFKQSSSNGLIFIVKYNENGSIIYNKTIGNLDGSDYDDYGYMDVMLNDDGSLSLVYEPHIYQTYVGNVYYFLKIDNQGNTVSSFSKEIKHQGILGKIDSENFYFLTKEVSDENNNTYTYKFYKILDENNQSSFELTDTEFINYYKNVVLDQTKLTIDKNKNFYLTCHNISDNDTKEKIHFSKIGNDNKMKYSLTTSDSDNYYLIGSFINGQGENIIIANNLNDNSIDFIHVDENNELQIIKNSDNILATGFKENDDSSFFITTSNTNIRLFSNELTEIRSFNTSYDYLLRDFSKINENNIIAASAKIDKMYPESDYTTQIDIYVEKLNDSQILNSYSYSGIGTSRAFQQRVIIDNENNYLVLVTEKMGPEYLGIGGQNPPLNKRIIKYDSNLNLLWEVEIPDHIFNLVNHGGRDIEYYLDTNNNLYLNLPRAGNNYGLGYDIYKVSSTGNIEFMFNSYIPDKFYTTGSSIYIAQNYFLYEESSKLLILNKTNGNLVEEIDVGHEEFLEIFSIGTNDYFYTYEKVSNNYTIYLYKNGKKLLSRSFTSYYGIYPYEVDDKGTLYFSTTYQGWKINKLDINNSYSNYSTSDKVGAIKKFSNGNLFVYLENYKTLIFDKDLKFISNGEDIKSWNPYLMTEGNNIVFGTGSENSVRVVNPKGEVIDYFKINGFLHNWYSKFDKLGDLIMVGQFGNRIYTFNEYSWFRGFIHKYKISENTLSNDDINLDDKRKNFIVYPNPTSDILNIKIQNFDIEKVVLYDLTGNHLKEFNSNEIDLSNFKSGIYLIKIYTTSNSVINSKIIKN